MMEPLLTELAAAALTAYEKSGLLASLAVALTFSVRLYRLEGLQRILPLEWRWAGLRPFTKAALPFLVAFAGALGMALLGGAPLVTALVGALVAAGSSVGIHHGTKAAGKVAHPVQYKPSKFRSAASIIVPIPRERMAPKL